MVLTEDHITFRELSERSAIYCAELESMANIEYSSVLNPSGEIEPLEKNMLLFVDLKPGRQRTTVGDVSRKTSFAQLQSQGVINGLPTKSRHPT